ncbi:MAG: sorting protein [Betaproteobacteria bacterium]|nr:sorting protein [Betaproteobacteria bacterium]
MKLLKTIVLSTALALAPLAVQAETFNFSYTFDPISTGDGNPLALTGSFSEDLGGLISNISVFLNGTSFSGHLVAEGVDASGNASATIAPIVSANAGDNKFVFFNTDASNQVAFFGGQLFAINFNTVDGNFNPISGFETADGAKWTLTTLPVPEPSSYALLLAGLGLMTMVARRRSQR